MRLPPETDLIPRDGTELGVAAIYLDSVIAYIEAEFRRSPPEAIIALAKKLDLAFHKNEIS
jgi:hypothetical protein